MQIHALHNLYINKTRNHILKSKVKCLYLFLDLDKFYGDVITILNNSRNVITSCLVKMALFLLQHHRYGNRHSDRRSLTSCHRKQKNNKNNWWLGYEWIAKKTNHGFISSFLFFFFVSSFWLVFFFLNPRPLCHLLILSVSRSFNGNSKSTKENAMQIFQNVLQSLNAIAQVSSSTNLKKIVYWTLCKNNIIHNILFIIPTNE